MASTRRPRRSRQKALERRERATQIEVRDPFDYAAEDRFFSNQKAS